MIQIREYFARYDVENFIVRYDVLCAKGEGKKIKLISLSGDTKTEKEVEIFPNSEQFSCQFICSDKCDKSHRDEAKRILLNQANENGYEEKDFRRLSADYADMELLEI